VVPSCTFVSFVVYDFTGPYAAHPDILTAPTRGNTVVMLCRTRREPI
jgi:hypothetical protein